MQLRSFLLSLPLLLGLASRPAYASPYGGADPTVLHASATQIASAEAMLAEWWATTGYTNPGVVQGQISALSTHVYTKQQYTLTVAQRLSLQARIVAWAWNGMWSGQLNLWQAQHALYQGMANHMAKLSGTAGGIYWTFGTSTVSGFSDAVYNATNLIRKSIEAANAAASAGSMAVTGAVNVIKAGAAIQVPVFIMQPYTYTGPEDLWTDEFHQKTGVDVLYDFDAGMGIPWMEYDPSISGAAYEAQYDVGSDLYDDYFEIQSSGDPTGGGSAVGGVGGGGEYDHNAGHDPGPPGPVIYGGPASEESDLNIKYDSTNVDENGRWTDACFPPDPVPPFDEGWLLGEVETVECPAIAPGDVPLPVFSAYVTDGTHTALTQLVPMGDGFLLMPAATDDGYWSPPVHLIVTE